MSRRSTGSDRENYRMNPDDRSISRARRSSMRRQSSQSSSKKKLDSSQGASRRGYTRNNEELSGVYNFSESISPSSRSAYSKSRKSKRPAGAMHASHALHSTRGGSRTSHRNPSTLAEAVRSKSRRRVFTIGIAILLVVVVLAVAVGVYVYFRTTDANLRLDPSNAAEALVSAADDKAVYVLCAADMDNPMTKKVEEESIGYMLVRADIANRVITFVTIPSQIQVRMSDGSLHPLTEAVTLGGDAELITAVSSLTGIGVNHFIYTSAQHLSGMVDLLGGVNIDVTQEVDDPNAGIKVIEAGQQILNGQDSLVFLRATNFPDGFEKTAANRVEFTLALLGDALNSAGLSYASIVSGASSYINTDFSASDLLSLGEEMRPLDGMTVYSCVLPYYETVDSESGQEVVSLYKSEWEEMKTLVDNGDDPGLVDSAADNVVPSDVTVEVRNGTQMVGAAARLGEILEQFGYKVSGVGNTDDGTVYPETLIVYTDSAYEGAAKAIVRDIGSGRVVNGGDFYSSQADVIAIIGADYMPAI